MCASVCAFVRVSLGASMCVSMCASVYASACDVCVCEYVSSCEPVCTSVYIRACVCVRLCAHVRLYKSCLRRSEIVHASVCATIKCVRVCVFEYVLCVWMCM